MKKCWMLSPHNKVIQPASARKGPKAAGEDNSCLHKIFLEKIKSNEDNAAINSIKGKLAMPDHAARAANNFISPWPRPSFFLSHLNKRAINS